MSKKSVRIAGQIRQKRKGFIIAKDNAIDAIHAANNFKIISVISD